MDVNRPDLHDRLELGGGCGRLQVAEGIGEKSAEDGVGEDVIEYSIGIRTQLITH